VTPTVRLTSAPTAAIRSEIRAPKRVRVRRSRPLASVPNQWADEGGRSEASVTGERQAGDRGDDDRQENRSAGDEERVAPARTAKKHFHSIFTRRSTTK
jgi:hypothetical protein